MRRTVFTILAAVSAVLLLGVMVEAMRSFATGERIVYAWQEAPGAWYWQDNSIQLDVGNGGVQISLFQRIATTPAQAMRFASPALPPGLTHSRVTLDTGLKYPAAPNNWLGFEFGHGGQDFRRSHTSSPSWDRYSATVPAWVLMIPLAILPALWLRRRMIERKRNRVGFCQTCGYDLRATPNRCPECGTVVASSSPLSNSANTSPPPSTPAAHS
ncbi:MAG TPA: hypothetical protein VIL86_18840 [Tepidisphaeraceae bacterium]|jgi:hypothetical protein